jgi:hypothetical protein
MGVDLQEILRCDARSLLLMHEISYILYFIVALYFYRLYFILILSCLNVKNVVFNYFLSLLLLLSLLVLSSLLLLLLSF